MAVAPAKKKKPKKKSAAADTLSIALWVANLSHPVKSTADWCTTIEKMMKDCRRRGCDVLILPEYISEHWMSFSPKGLKATEELGWCAGQAQKAIKRLEKSVKDIGVALLAGTMPWKDGEDIVNRAWMLFPDRPPVHHDKLVLIPSEKSADGWMVRTGDTVRLFEWRGLRMAILVCLDIEMPALSRVLAGEDIDLILVPSMTEKAAGYHRVFNCARARAVELMTTIAVTGCVGGSVKDGQARTQCCAGAAIYIPSEEAFGQTGIFAELPMRQKQVGVGPVLHAYDIPLGRIRAARRGQAEAWPGAWSADWIKVKRA